MMRAEGRRQLRLLEEHKLETFAAPMQGRITLREL